MDARFDLNNPADYAGATYAPPIPNDPGTIQSTLLRRLKERQPGFAALTGIDIDAFPDDPENWRAVSQVGTVLVRWEGFEAGAKEDVGIVVQAVKHKFKIGVLARGLGWSDAAGVSPQGGYSILTACLKILLGFKVPGCEKTYAGNAEFIRRDRQGGIWIYGLDVFVETVITERPAEAVFPNLLEGIANNTVGTSTESVNTEGQP